MQKYSKIIQRVYLTVIFTQIIGLFLVSPINILTIDFVKRVGFLFVGFDFIGLGTLGLLKNSILLNGIQPLKYAEGAYSGKIVNIGFIIAGVLFFAFGLFTLFH